MSQQYLVLTPNRHRRMVAVRQANPNVGRRLSALAITVQRLFIQSLVTTRGLFIALISSSRS